MLGVRVRPIFGWKDKSTHINSWSYIKGSRETQNNAGAKEPHLTQKGYRPSETINSTFSHVQTARLLGRPAGGAASSTSFQAPLFLSEAEPTPKTYVMVCRFCILNRYLRIYIGKQYHTFCCSSLTELQRGLFRRAAVLRAL